VKLKYCKIVCNIKDFQESNKVKLYLKMYFVTRISIYIFCTSLLVKVSYKLLK